MADEVQAGELGYERIATVVCWECEDSESEPFSDLEQARARFERMGWELVGGHWFCPDCVEESDGD